MQNANAIVDGFPDIYEAQVLLCCIVDFGFYTKFSGVLCRDTLDPQLFYNDFSDPAYNTILKSLRGYRAAVADNPSPPKPQDLVAILHAMEKQGDITDTDLALALSKLNELLAATPMSPAVIQSSVNYWLKKSRSSKTLARAVTGELDNDAVLEELQKQKDVIDQSVGEKTVFRFSEAALQSQEEDRPRYQTGIAGLDKALGGGLARQEFTLFVCPSGGGKTVNACNLSYHLTTQNLRGLLITTEQPPKELIPRFVSAQCNIPFDIIKDGVRPDRLNSKQQDDIQALYAHLDSHLLMVDWGQSDHSVEHELKNEIRRAQSMLGRVDFVILDWIGGSLGAQAKNDMNNFRRIMKNAADSLDMYGKREDIITVGYAQATTMLAKNKKKVDRTMLGECKTMHEKATNLIGISALTAETDDDSDAATYQDKQFFFIDKARKGKGGCISVKRDFAYQRFNNWGKV